MRIISKRKIFFDTRVFKTRTDLVVVEEFRVIISPNNIFTLAQIQIFIFLSKRESRNARLSEMD